MVCTCMCSVIPERNLETLGTVVIIFIIHNDNNNKQHKQQYLLTGMNL